ncbi:TonB-dependent siderophore receptor [Janthinobacterium sp. SUN026]|uniref:TonB-dependent siderophore receptor n=1 Tax=Janthinobacterium sp. SUN026 TaxID=3002438 RepID=UPI0025B152A2|nr:TonB-dependent siderophore receptor [Janthinobacterium sp. SUN026]MDN2670380.1 TonB-dependent siderophore receptor [Janthinobacterium sp. SUN026]
MTIHSAQRKAAALAPTLMAAAILGTLGAPAHGQTQQQEQNLPEVRVNAQAASATTEGSGSYTSGSMNAATRLNLSVRETPQSVSVVTRQQMDDMNIRSVEDIANITPGLSLNKGATERASFYSRGFSISNFTEDGLTMSADGDTLGFATLAMYDRVEILRGAAGMLNGVGNPSGTMNFVRKRPTAQNEVSLTGSIGRYNDYRGEVDARGALNQAGSLRGRAVAAYQDTDTFISNYRHKRALLYATADADLSRDTTLSVGFHVNDERNPGSTWYGLPTALDGSFLPLDRSASNAPDWTFWNKKNTRLFAELEHRLGDGWKVKLAAQALQDELDSVVTGIARVPKTNLFRLSAANAFVYDRQQRIVDAQAAGPFSLLGRRHEIVFGANYRTRDTEDKGYKSVPDYSYTFNPVRWDTGAPVKPAIGTFYYGQDSKTKQTGVYTTARFSLADPLALLVGGRVDWYDYRAINTLSGARSGYKVSREVTPYAGLVYDVDAHHSLYGSWTSIFNPQSAVDRNGVLLDPVTGINMEAGVKGEYFGGALNASAAVFRIVQKNLATALPLTQCGPGLLSCSEAVGEVRSDGFELSVSGALTPRWQVSAGFTYNTAEYAKAQGSNAVGARYAAERPSRLLRLSTSYRLSDAWRVGGALRAQNQIYKTNSAIRQGGYAVADLNAGWHVNRQLDVRLSVTNVFDRSYYQAISSIDSGNAFGDPRSAVLTAKYTF